MEQLYYLLIFFTFCAGFNRKYVVIFSYFLSPLLVRYSGFDVDINNYSNYISVGFDSVFAHASYMREPVFWYPASLLVDLGVPSIGVFLIYDYIALACIYYAWSRSHLKAYWLLFFLLFFPFFLGIQNVYRQYLGAAFFLLSMSVVGRKRLFFLLLSLLTHNLYILMLPVWLVYSHKKAGKIIGVTAAFLISVLVQFVPAKTHASTGIDLHAVYLFLLVALFLFLLVRTNNVYNRRSICLLCFLLVFISFYQHNSSIYVERLGMAGMMIFSFYIIDTVKSFKDPGIRFLLRVFLSLPIFLFSSTKNFINGGLF